MYTLLSVLFGAVCGATLTFVIQSFYSRRSQDIAHLNDFISDFQKIEHFSVKYWLGDSVKNPNIQKKLSVQLRGALHASSIFYEVGKDLLASDWEKFKELDAKLFDTTTGGAFETNSQTPEPSRVTEIMEITNAIRLLLRSARRKTYGIR